MFTSGQVIAVGFLDVLGLVLNAWFLYTVKVRPSPYNAIDVLQALKTIFVLLALISSIWLDVVTCSECGSKTTVLLCIGSKAILENLLFHSICWTFFSVACVRRKVCKCRGRAAVLVTTKYAIKTMVLAFMPAGMFIAATVSLITSYSNYSMTFTSLNTTTSGLMDYTYNTDTITDLIMSEHSKIVYQVCHTMILNVIPIVTSLVMYINIVTIVRQTALNSEGYISNRNKNPTKLITLSVVILLSCTCSLWGVYASTIIVSVFLDVPKTMFIFLKLAILIGHPFGEGLLHPTARKSGDRVHRSIQDRSARQIYPDYSPSMTSGQEGDGAPSLNVLLPSLIEEKESSISDKIQGDQNYTCSAMDLTKRKQRERFFHPRPSVLMKNAAFIGLEYREEPAVVTLTRRRRESEDRIRNGLTNITEDVESPATCRKLSSCLRLSSVDDFSDEDVYDSYRAMYMSGYKKCNEKAHYPSSTYVGEYKGIAYAKTNTGDRGTSRGATRPKSRWKKLITAARTVRHLSQTSQPSPQTPIAEDELEHAAVNTQRQLHKQSRRSSTSKQEVNKIDMYHLTTSDTYATYNETDQNSRRKLSYVSTKPRKKRSVSVTRNDYANSQHGKRKTRERIKSFSFIPPSVDGNSKSSEEYHRSKSLGLNGLVNFRKEGTEQASKSKRKRKESKYSLGEISRTDQWEVTPTTTRDECIQNVLQWKDYF